MADYIYLVLLFPLIGVVVNGLLLGRLPKMLVSIIGCGTIGLSFITSVLLFIDLTKLDPEARVLQQTLFTWIPSGSFQVNFAFLVDPLSAVMILVVTGVGFLIHVYSTGYMANDPGYGRYFTYLNLFTFAMLTLVLADNYLLLFVGWEGVGLCSYLLIGFWYEKKSATDAGKKAFIVNRIGDFGFLLGVFIIFWNVGSLDFLTVAEKAPAVFAVGGGLVTAACLLLFLGAAGKSAQIPLFVWLPDAMEGPTPVSALIHAATMVTAGVYLLARSNVLFLLAPDALMVVAVVGALTAFFAATVGLAQNDIKRVLAYSTVSQLGYMFLACGVAAFSASIFHLMTHAFFKALLFLGAGSVIHAMSDEQDMRRMGGLKKHLPITYATMLIATLAISGIPGFSGFFSKDEILWKSFSSGYGHWAFWVVGVATAGLTAFYMFRLIYLTFHGPERISDHAKSHLHESPKSMTIPLMILALLAVVGGWIGLPHIFGVANRFEHWLDPVFNKAMGDASPVLASPGVGGETGLEWTLMGASVLLILIAWFASRYFYKLNLQAATSWQSRLSGVHKILLNKYYIDEIYSTVIVRPVIAGSMFLWKIFDVLIIDGLVNGLATVTADISNSLKYLQSGQLRFYALVFLTGVVAIIGLVIFG